MTLTLFVLLGTGVAFQESSFDPLQLQKELFQLRSYAEESDVTLRDDLGIGFNETLGGFWSEGQVDYQQGFDDGELNDRKFSFEISVGIASVTDFIEDPLHSATCDGVVKMDGLTPLEGSEIINGTLEVFPNGVQDGFLHMYYFLPFFVDNEAYHMEGIKNVDGEKCITLLAMSTTLYTRVRRGHVWDEGEVVSTGIVEINVAGIIELITSLEVVGEGSIPEKLLTFIEWGLFLLSLIVDLCIDISTMSTEFWYLWSSNGNSGFLLDLIKRPEDAQLRMQIWDNDLVNPVLDARENFDLSEFELTETFVRIGTCTIFFGQSVNGTIDEVPIDFNFALSGRQMSFVPPVLADLLGPLIPNVQSNYGSMQGGNVGPHEYAPGLPAVYSTYPVMTMALWKWSLISAVKFAGTDLQIEIVGTDIVGLIFGTSYVYYQGNEYVMNNPLLRQTHIGAFGEIDGNRRVFSAELDHTLFRFTVECEAPLSKFALLERHGLTRIMTTALGDCTATEHNSGNVYYTEESSLLEVKS